MGLTQKLTRSETGLQNFPMLVYFSLTSEALGSREQHDLDCHLTRPAQNGKIRGRRRKDGRRDKCGTISVCPSASQPEFRSVQCSECGRVGKRKAVAAE